MLWLVAIHSALPCAALITSETQLASSDAQEAILDLTGADPVIEYRVQYDGDASELGWVIPVLGEFGSLQDGDPDRFDGVRSASQPTVEWSSVDDGGGGLGCGAKSGGDGRANLADTADVAVLAQGFTGTYDYAVVDADSAESLASWGSDNGFETSGVTVVVEEYLDEGRPILLVKVAPDDAETPLEGRYLPPLRLTYSGDAAYPARMGRSSSTQTMDTTLYVIGPERAEMSGWQTVELPWLDGGDDPESAYAAELLGIGLQQGYALVHAAPYQGAFLTRFDTRAPVDVHTADPAVTVEGGLGELHLRISAQGSDTGGSAAWLLPLLGLGWLVRRRD